AGEVLFLSLASMAFPRWPSFLLIQLAGLSVGYFLIRALFIVPYLRNRHQAEERKSRLQWVRSGLKLMAAATVFLLAAFLNYHLLTYHLLFASHQCDIVSVKFYLGLGANVNARNWYNWNAYCQIRNEYDGDPWWAIPGNLNNGIGTIYDRTPLMYAVEGQNIELVNLLLAEGAAVDEANCLNRTAFMKAMAKRNLPIAKLLLTHGADINQQDYNKDSALIRAAKVGDVKGIEFLLANGANPGLRNYEGQTAFHIMAQASSDLSVSLKSATHLREEHNLDK
ncbi:MAG TPA: ankyrin repeat domain-containing protein, partial [Acidobacteriota bacterium]|nr:ankyrin repeat domain-containing protein [Acidobacteriota bacterium]